MNPLTCDEVAELAGAYVLGLLDADERAAIETHLAEHWHEEYASARAAVLALASAAPEAEPSPELRARALDIARLEARPVARPKNRRWIPGLLSGAAAAAIVLAVLGYTGVFDRGSPPPQQLAVRNATSSAFFDLSVGDGTTANIRLGGLPTRPDSEVYQVWLIHEGQPPKSLCVVGADREGPWSWAVSVRLTRGDTIAVTVEPDGTRTAPSTTPIIAGQYY